MFLPHFLFEMTENRICINFFILFFRCEFSRDEMKMIQSQITKCSETEWQNGDVGKI